MSLSKQFRLSKPKSKPPKVSQQHRPPRSGFSLHKPGVSMRTVILTLVTGILVLSVACGPSSNNNNSSSASPSLTIQQSPSVETGRGEIDFVRAISSDYVDYELSGLGSGDSSRMNLKVRNNTERVWEVKIEIGTKLEPEGGDVQRMVVTKEYEIEVEPHEVQSLDLEVSCLDISKPAPSVQDKSWRIASSPNLKSFLECANTAVERDETVSAAERPILIQLSLWQARGATREDWLEFFQKYHGLSAEEAEQLIAELVPPLQEIIRNCPTVLNI